MMRVNAVMQSDDLSLMVPPFVSSFVSFVGFVGELSYVNARVARELTRIRTNISAQRSPWHGPA